MSARFEVRTRGKQWIVYCTKTKAYITKAIPDKDIAEEIAKDFESMSKGDMRSIGMPDLSKRNE